MKIIFIILGFIFTGLGCIGIPVPVLPTTPFLLLAAICFAKGSKRLENWFKSTKLYHKHLEGFVQNRSMTLKAKLTILFTASAMLLLSFGMMQYKAIVNGNTVGNIIGRVTILIMIPIKYIYFFTRIKTIPSEKKELASEKKEFVEDAHYNCYAVEKEGSKIKGKKLYGTIDNGKLTLDVSVKVGMMPFNLKVKYISEK